jgi:ABC-type transporter Mla maintaining outer membrane lipid asymmetry ATPase subunit MlaF
MTLEDNLALPLTRWTSLRGPIVHELVQAKLDLVGLGPFARHLRGEISGGMKKRAGIGRALMLEPDLLFFDEPSAGLDPITAVELDDLIVSLSRDLGITVVIVTHELPEHLSRCRELHRARRGGERHRGDRSTGLSAGRIHEGITRMTNAARPGA